MRRRLALLPATVLLISPLVSCGAATTSSKPSTGAVSTSPGEDTTSIAGLTVTKNVGTAPEVTVQKVDVTKGETDVIVDGTGSDTTAGGKALINLHLVNGTTGKKAYSSFDSGAPIEVTLSPSDLPQALVDALAGQAVGSRIVYAAPVEEAIGAKGAPEIGLETSQDAVFVVDIMSVPPTDTLTKPEGSTVAAPKDAPQVVTQGDAVTGIDFGSAPATPSDKLQVITLVQGDGPAIPDSPTYVSFNYFGEVYGAKESFDESYSRGVTPFVVGNGQLIKGWDQGLAGVKQGSRIMMIVPPDLGYGADGSGDKIPADSTLVFVIDVLGVDTGA